MSTVSPAKAWLLATRPWSLTAAFVPLAIGSLAACADGNNFLLGRFLLLILAGVSLQIATNFLNAHGDFLSGVDTRASAAGLSQIVEGNIAPQALYRAGLAMLGVGAFLGTVLTMMAGWQILVFGTLGLLGAYAYTSGVFPYKYHAMGPFMVFFLMGPLMTAPAYFSQAETLPAIAYLSALPIACLVTAIMHANDIRDIAHDRAARIRTLAMNLGRYKAMRLFIRLYGAAFLFTVILGFFQPAFFLPLVLLPAALRTIKPLQGDFNDLYLSNLDIKTAQLHLQFGLLIIAGLLLTSWLNAHV